MLNLNYFKTAARQLLRDKTNSFISITGLAVGMTCCMLIGIFIRDEISFNKFNNNRNDIYRVNGAAGNGREPSAVYRICYQHPY